MKLFRRYDPATPPEERKGAPVCVVSHPDAGGPCGGAAVGEVWSLPFCEVHGREAGLSAAQELAHDAARQLRAVVAAEEERWPRKAHLIEAVEGASVPDLGSDCAPAERERIRLAAFPPDDSRTHPDTLSFDYEDYGDGPLEWWSEAREYVCRWMREAHEAGQPTLLRDLERIREHATVQEILAERDMERRWVAPVGRRGRQRQGSIVANRRHRAGVLRDPGFFVSVLTGRAPFLLPAAAPHRGVGIVRELFPRTRANKGKTKGRD